MRQPIIHIEAQFNSQFVARLVRLFVLALLVAGLLGRLSSTSWAASGAELQVLLDVASGRLDANAEVVNRALAAGQGVDVGATIGPIYTFLSGEAYRLRQQPKKARDAYQSLVQWGANDPYGDGWGGSSLTSLALWRWLQIVQSRRTPCPNGAVSCGPQKASPLDHREAAQLLQAAEALRQMRLPQGLFTVAAFGGLPQLGEDIARRLAWLAWRIGQQDRATELFLDYLTRTDQAPSGAEEERLLNRVLTSGLASRGRLSLLQGKHLIKALGRRSEAMTAFHQAMESRDAQVRAEARLYLAALLPQSARSEAIASLTSVIETAANPHIVQQALLARARQYNRAGANRNTSQFLRDLTRLVETFPRGRFTDEALYDLAQYFQHTGNVERAQHYFKRLQTDPRTPSKWSDLAAFQAAMTAYTRGQPTDITDAIVALEAEGQGRPFGPLHLNRLFWLGRMHAEQGRDKLAQSYFQRLLAAHPFSYYGIRARMHLEFGHRARRELWPGIKTQDDVRAVFEQSTPPVQLSRVSPYHARLQVALDTGLYAAVHATDQDVLRRFPSQRLPDVPLAQLDQSMDLAPLGIWLALRQDAMAASEVRTTAANRLQLAGMIGRLGNDWPLALTLIEDPTAVFKLQESIQHDRQYLAVAYPVLFREEIGQSSQSHNVPSALLYGVARQTSWFYHAARSSTGALGVLQFSPDTFQALNERWRVLDASPAATRAEFLLNPQDSLNLGALWFAKELLPRRQGQILLALMEYHAGEAAVNTWQAEWRRLQRDYDVEYMIATIPSESTRRFVRRVLTDMMIVHATDLLSPYRSSARVLGVNPGQQKNKTSVSREPSIKAGRSRYRVALLPTSVSDSSYIFHAEDRAAKLVQDAVQESDVLELTFLSNNADHMEKVSKDKNISTRDARQSVGV